MHDRFVLLKRERGLTDQERLLLDGWTKNCPYRLKEAFYGIYDSPRLATHTATASNRFRTACTGISSR
nr:hypothetical protein [Burkholderia ambifaria]